MKRLSIRLFLIASVLVIVGSGFSRKPAAKPQPNVLYFFYLYEDDSFLDWATTDDEAYALWCATGAYVDQSQNGGATRIAQGFTTDAQPHNFPPVVILWAHY